MHEHAIQKVVMLQCVQRCCIEVCMAKLLHVIQLQSERFENKFHSGAGNKKKSFKPLD